MPWKGKIKFREDLLAPATEISIDYTGKNTFWIMTAVPRLLKDTMKISGAKVREDDIRWDISGEPKSFYGAWQAYRGEDKWTYTHVKIWAHGTIDRNGFGSVKVRFRGFLVTEFKYNNPLSYALWSILNYIFYWKQRRTYLDFSKNNLMEIRQKILETYGISR